MAIARRLAGSTPFRALVSAGLIALVLTRIDFGDAGDRLAGGSIGWFVAAVSALVASFVVGALRWRLYLAAAGIDARPAATVRAYLIGMFTTNFLPSQLGGDVTRALVAAGPGARVRSAATVVVDRLTALACLIAVAWVALAADPTAVPGTLVLALGAATAATALVAAAGTALAAAGPWIGSRLPARARPHAREAGAGIRACVRPGVLARTGVAGLAFQALVALSTWCAARAVDVPLPFAVLTVCIPAVLIATAAPVSIGGFGVREGMFVLLLGHAGVGSTDATVVSLASAIAFVVASLPGGLALALPGRRRPTEPGVSPGGAGR